MKYGIAIVLLTMALPGMAQVPKPPRAGMACNKNPLFTVDGIPAWSTSSRPRAFFYKSGLFIDADGAYRAYHPDDRLGLDSLAHAGHPGNWWALVTDNEKTSGHPILQGKSDPAPGYYVSTTALYDPDNPNPRDPHRYVDAMKIPYVVLTPKALHYARLGDFATVVNLQNGKVVAAIVADESAPDLPVGEGSIALAEALGVDSDPRYGGKNKDIVDLIYSGSGNGKPRELKDILANSQRLFASWGNLDLLNACFDRSQ